MEIVNATENVIKLSDKSVKYYCFRCKDYQHYLTDEPERDCPHCGARMERIPRSTATRIRQKHYQGTGRWRMQISSDIRGRTMICVP